MADFSGVDRRSIFSEHVVLYAMGLYRSVRPNLPRYMQVPNSFFPRATRILRCAYLSRRDYPAKWRRNIKLRHLSRQATTHTSHYLFTNEMAPLIFGTAHFWFRALTTVLR